MIEEIKMELEDSMEKALSSLKNHLTKVRTGRASANVLDGVNVDYYGSPTPLNQASNINTPDAKTISVQPWDKSMLELMEKAILDSNLGFTPNSNGEMIIINVPPLTEERRISLVKQLKSELENAKVSIRSSRKDSNDYLKKLEGLSEDIIKDAESEIQRVTDEFSKKVDVLFSKKESEIMTV